MASDEKLDLDALEALERKATDGPWRTGYWSGRCNRAHGPEEKGPWHGNGFCVYDHEWNEDEDGHHLSSHTPSHQVAGNYDVDSGGIVHRKDADLIVTLRNNARALIAEARRARELEKYTYHRGQCDYFYSHPVPEERPCSCGLSALLRKDGERG